VSLQLPWLPDRCIQVRVTSQNLLQFCSNACIYKGQEKRKEKNINFMQTTNICLWLAAAQDLSAQLFTVKK
jgi:hypothetical protein